MFQKKVLVVASLIAAAAVAQAQVKVYGYVELDVGSYKGAGDAKSVTKVESGNMMTSFIGFSGAEDLGGGLKAEFTLETYINADTGASVPNNAGKFWGRASNVALSGSFGKVALGEYDNPLFTAGLTYNPFGSSYTFSPTMAQYYGFAGNETGAVLSVDTSFVNSITYETPNMGGLMATLQYSPKESNADGAKDSVTFGASYNAGPLSVMAVYGDHGFTPADAPAYAGKQKVASLNGSYDFGVVKGFLQYTDVDNDTTFNEPDAELYQVGASVPVMSAGKVMVSYGQAEMKSINISNKVFSLGYDHSLSKRTGVFAAYSQEKHTDLTTGKVIATGVRHSF